MLQTDPVLEIIRREPRRISPGVRIDIDQIRSVLMSEVIKREVIEGDKADEARKKIAKVAAKALRASNSKTSQKGPEDDASPNLDVSA